MVQRKTVTIYRNLDNTTGGGPEWNILFPQVAFTPDEVIVRSISVSNFSNPILDYTFNLYSTLINDNLFSVILPNGYVTNQPQEIHHSLGNQLNGAYVFRAIQMDGRIPARYNNTQIAFTLEFVKYT